VCALASNPPLRRCGFFANDFDGIFHGVSAATGPDFTQIVLCPDSFLFMVLLSSMTRRLSLAVPLETAL
jgi:hypothetical protein